MYMPRMLRLQHVRLANAALFPWARCTARRTVASSASQLYAEYDSVSSSGVSGAASSTDPVFPDFPIAPYERTYANYVSLIGHLGGDPDFVILPSGRPLSKMRLAINRGTEDNRVTDWYDVEAWGDLARQCHQHLRKGAWLNIQGRLKVDAWTDKETQAKRTKVQVVASNIDRMQSTRQPSPVQAGGSAQYSNQAYSPQQPSTAYVSPAPAQAYPDSTASGLSYGGPTMDTYQAWLELIANPSGFWDNRETKRNPKGPDFKHKTTGTGLWLNSAPVDLRDKLAELGLSGSVPY